MITFVRKRGQRAFLVFIFIAAIFTFLLPQAEVLASSANASEPNEERAIDFQPTVTAEELINIKLPVNEIKVLRTKTVTITAYNALPEQTDSTPCITADGTDICKNKNIKVVAANWLPFGTKVRIPEYFGDTVFEVHDRMNPKYNNRLDVLMESVPEAKRFGRRTLQIEILD
jgi:3D (Asp-Asp-Asp) domain-containing protein